MVSISNERKNKLFFDLQNNLGSFLNGDNSKAFDYTLDTNIKSTSDGDLLKIALHIDPAPFKKNENRFVRLKSLTNPSRDVYFNVNKTFSTDFNLDDHLFTALDSLLRLVPEDFTNIKPQNGDTSIFLNNSRKFVGDRVIVDGNSIRTRLVFPNNLNISKAPQVSAA
jgi:hypothetical protein